MDGVPVHRGHHKYFLFAKAELKNWRARKNPQEQSDPVNESPEKV
jgi:hypothetical protein